MTSRAGETLAQMHPEAYRRAQAVCPDMAVMFHHFTRFKDAGEALGHATGSAFSKFNQPDNDTGTSEQTKRLAKMWVAANVKPAEPSEPETPQPAGMVLVAGSSEALEKISKLAKIFGCELVEV